MRLTTGLTLRDIVWYATNNGGPVNACVQEGTDGTWYGAGPGVGSMNPPVAIDGTPVYSFRWTSTASGEEGTILMSFGDTGVTKLTDVDEILITTAGGDSETLKWDDTTSDYRTVNLALTDALIADYELDKVRCFKADVLIEGLLIKYTFSQLLMGSK